MNELKPKDEVVVKNRLLFRNPYALLDGDGNFGYASAAFQDPDRGNRHSRHRLEEIEACATSIQEILHKNREKIWSRGIPDDEIKLLDPIVAIELLGYAVDYTNSLDQYSTAEKATEVAAIIDQSRKFLRISRKFNRNIQRFTAAHELGHAVMHNQSRLHRDRPLDHPGTKNTGRAAEEYEADKFATYFLMPERLVRKRFWNKFGTKSIVFNNEIILEFDPAVQSSLAKSNLSLREISTALAKCEYFKNRASPSLAAQFGVSIETMAIRFEELGLIEF